MPGSGRPSLSWRKIDQNLDNYTVEYTFPDETKLYFHGRNMAGCHQEFSSHAHGTKGYALISVLEDTAPRQGYTKDRDLTAMLHGCSAKVAVADVLPEKPILTRMSGKD